MQVRRLIETVFIRASSLYPDTHRAWTSLSIRIGKEMPNSLLIPSIQKAGELDLLIRCMEDEFSAESADAKPDFAFHYQVMLSELWVGHVYEIFRLLKERKFVPDDTDHKSLFHDLELLRIPLEKHEIWHDKKLTEPLRMHRYPFKKDTSDIYEYSKDDPKRSYIMPTEVSERGSVMWQVTDIISKSKQSYWVERQNLSERIFAIYHDDDVEKTTPK